VPWFDLFMVRNQFLNLTGVAEKTAVSP